jgi:hypothetical protein
MASNNHKNNNGDLQDNWFKFFHKRWLTSPRIHKMTLEHQAIYMRILCNMEIFGQLPWDTKHLAAILQLDPRTVATWQRECSDVVAFVQQQCSTDVAPMQQDCRTFVIPKFEELTGKMGKSTTQNPLEQNRTQEKIKEESRTDEVVAPTTEGTLQSTGKGDGVQEEQEVSTSLKRKKSPADTAEETASVLKNEFYSYLGHRIAKRFLAEREAEKTEKYFLSLLEGENATHIRNVMKYAFSGWWADTFKKANSPAEKFVEHFDTMAQQMVADSESQRGKRQGFSTIAGREGAGELFAEWEEDEEKEQAK